MNVGPKVKNTKQKITQPKTNKLTVILSNGEVWETQWTGASTEMRLSVDMTNHPIWTGSRQHQEGIGQAAKFKNKFNI